MHAHNHPLRTEVSESSSTSELTAAESGALAIVLMRSKGGRHGIRRIAIVAGPVVAIVIFALSVAPPLTHGELHSPLVGHQSPAVTGTDITGSAFDLGSQRGHFVVVNFFASWCVPCRTEQPQLVTFVEHQYHGPTLVGVIFLDTTAAIGSLLGLWNGLYPVITDPGGRIVVNFVVSNPPSKYVIDPKGIVFAKIIGPVTAQELDSIVSRAMAQVL